MLLWFLLPMLGEVLQLRGREADDEGGDEGGGRLVWAIPPSRARRQLRDTWCLACLVYGVATVATRPYSPLNPLTATCNPLQPLTTHCLVHGVATVVTRPL